MSGLAALQRTMARALIAPDPIASLRRARRDRSLPKDLRGALGQIDEDGFRMSALLIARLRFERLLRGSSSAAEQFEREPAAFVELFRAYHARVPPRDLFPQDEAARFRRWQARR